MVSVFFTDEDGYITDEDSREIAGIFASYYETTDDDVAGVVESMVGVLISCDPFLEEKDATELIKQIMDASMDGEPYYNNGIGYVIRMEGEYMQLVVSVYYDF